MHFSDVATQLNELVRFFDLNTIGPFMYDENLEFFIARFRQANSVRWPYLRYAIKHMYEKHYLHNRTTSDQPEDGDGEWINIEEDSDDEIVFKANTVAGEGVPNEQLDDTLLYNQSLRQQDECQDQHQPQGDNPTVDNWIDYDDYTMYNPPDQFEDTFYSINDTWTNDTDVKMLYADANRQVDRDETGYNDRYVTHTQDGYTVEQVVPEACEMDIGPVLDGQAQEVYTVQHELDFRRATETQPNWAPTPVKVVGPEPEPRELYFHDQASLVSNQKNKRVKTEPPSITSTLKKKVQMPIEEDIYPLHTPKSESKSITKLTNMFAEDLPQGDHATQTYSSNPSMVNMFSMRFTEPAAATDYDLYAPNPRRPNNNNPRRGPMG